MARSFHQFPGVLAVEAHCVGVEGFFHPALQRPHFKALPDFKGASPDGFLSAAGLFLESGLDLLEFVFQGLQPGHGLGHLLPQLP